MSSRGWYLNRLWGRTVKMIYFLLRFPLSGHDMPDWGRRQTTCCLKNRSKPDHWLYRTRPTRRRMDAWVEDNKSLFCIQTIIPISYTVRMLVWSEKLTWWLRVGSICRTGYFLRTNQKGDKRWRHPVGHTNRPINMQRKSHNSLRHNKSKCQVIKY